MACPPGLALPARHFPLRKITNLSLGEQPQRFCLQHTAAMAQPQATVEDHMPRMSNSPTANRVLNSTAELERFDATEIRSLTLDEIDFVTGGSKTTGQVSFNPF